MEIFLWIFINVIVHRQSVSKKITQYLAIGQIPRLMPWAIHMHLCKHSNKRFLFRFNQCFFIIIELIVEAWKT